MRVCSVALQHDCWPLHFSSRTHLCSFAVGHNLSQPGCVDVLLLGGSLCQGILGCQVPHSLVSPDLKEQRVKRCDVSLLRSFAMNVKSAVSILLNCVEKLIVINSRCIEKIYLKTRLGVRQTVSSRNRLSSLNILACSSRSAQPLSRLPPNLGLRRFWLGPSGLDSVSFTKTWHSGVDAFSGLLLNSGR